MIPDLDPMEFARLAEALEAPPTTTRTAEEIVDYVRQQLYADNAHASHANRYGDAAAGGT